MILKILELNKEGHPEATKIFSHTSIKADISQTITKEETGTKSENAHPSIIGDKVHVMKHIHNYRVQRRLEKTVSPHEQVKRIRDAAGCEIFDE